MSLLENVKIYFTKKKNNEETSAAPKDVCPNCWGRQDWNKNYYEFMKGENNNPNEKMYNSFIKDVVTKLDKITLKGNSYTCITCNINYKK